ncbi:SDR family oxidoreductase [Flavobacteriales bacterium]|nr:SDR family oxidoreductase [Flavobacteriales bacterium]
MKNYLIIGGSSGIGKALTGQMALEGNVYSTFNKNETESNSDNINYYHLDVTADQIELENLPEEIHGLAYCPGSINLMPFKRIKPTQFTEDFELQVNGAIKVIQKVLPNLKKAGNSSILFFSTVAVQNGFNFHAQVAASKGAIEGLTRSLAAEFAPTIRVNAIAPSITDTPLAGKLLSTDEKKEANAQRHPLNSIGNPEKIAQLGAFILSEKASWMTGQIIHMDGGMSSIKG